MKRLYAGIAAIVLSTACCAKDRPQISKPILSSVSLPEITEMTKPNTYERDKFVELSGPNGRKITDQNEESGTTEFFFDNYGFPVKITRDKDDDGEIDAVWTSKDGWKYNCKGLKIGVVGASNTIASHVRIDYHEHLIKKCMGSEVFLYAKGGWGPRMLAGKVKELLAAHQDLDLVTLNPSENEMRRSSIEVYTQNAIHLAELIKSKNSKTTVVMLTTTPSKSHSNWTPDVEKIKLMFNEQLIKDRLGRPDLIDLAVNTFSPLEDPSNKGSCGKFCLNDKVHLDSEGEEVVVDTVLFSLFESGLI